MTLFRYALALSAALGLSIQASAQDSSSVSITSIPNTPYFYTNELIVELDTNALGQGIDDVVATLQSRSTNAGVLERFGSPSNARALSRIRMPQPSVAALAAADPERRLQSMVVLQFPNDDATRRAQMALARHPAVIAQSRNVIGRYSTDPLIPVDTDEKKYQWGHYKLNVIQPGNPTGVWATTKGNAYVAILDNGLQAGGNVHADLAANYRPQFSYNYGYAHNGATGGSLSPTNLDETPFLNYYSTYSAGHGTHVAGVVAASNDNGFGGSGVCPSCSIVAGRVTRVDSDGYGHYYAGPDSVSLATGLADVVSHGVQVVNHSLGIPSSAQVGAALAKAVARDVVVVAASGNGAVNEVDYPASDAHVIAVGGVNSLGAMWYEDPTTGSNWSEITKVQQFVAPAKDVMSTVYVGKDWNTDAPWNCGDSFPSGFATGYGDCTGTSMAAPHIAGLVGLMRSADPLKSRKNVRDILSATSNTTACTSGSTQCGLGVPDATKSVVAMLGGNNVLNRKTPLFSFYSSSALDHFYTTVPQMAMSAMERGGLLPQPASQPAVSYQGIGSTIGQYTAYPAATCSPLPCSNTPKAIAVVMTVAANPSGGTPLVPLYRMSYKCGDELVTSPPNAANPICASSPSHLSHFYSTDPTAVAVYTGYDISGTYVGGGLGYKLDGIEGFIYSTAVAQPSGTVRLCRKYDPARDDYVLFPGSGTGGLSCSATTDGYSGGNYYQTAGGTDWIGWVYPASTTIGATQTNAAPTISISSPANGSSFAKNSTVTINASASDSDGSISEVRFFVDQKLIASDTSSPFSATWSSGTKDTYTLTAIAIDNRGAVTASAPISIKIGAGAPTPPAFVNAGFESPSVGLGNYVANPTGAGVGWTFVPAGGSGSSGVSANSSAFTTQNPAAPELSQVGFLQGATTISQVVSFGSVGGYHLEFSWAQRYSNQTFLKVQLKVDGANWGSPFYPTSVNYVSSWSPSFPIGSTGSHTITLQGVNDGYDNTIFFDQVTIVAD